MCTTGSIDSVMNVSINAIDADGWYFIPVSFYDPNSAGYKVIITAHSDPNNILARTDLITSRENGIYLANNIIISELTFPVTDKDAAGDFERAYAFWQDKLDKMYPLQDDTQSTLFLLSQMPLVGRSQELSQLLDILRQLKGEAAKKPEETKS